MNIRILSCPRIVVSFFFVLLLSQPGWAQNKRAQQSAKDSAISVDFKECSRPKVQIPGAFNVNPDEVANLLNGVWVGTRTVKPGSALVAGYATPLTTYVMVYDMAAKESFVFEEHGEPTKGTAFTAQHDAAVKSGAPRITYFYCGSPALGAFRDEFVKVSDDPRIEPMERALSGSGTRMSLAKIWEALKDTQYFSKSRSFLNSAFYTVALTPNNPSSRLKQPRGFRDLRLDLVGQLRGSPDFAPAYANGQPVAGVESGVFQGVKAMTGNYIVSTAIAVPCNCAGGKKIEQDAPGLAHFTYTKVVIGPLRASPRR